MPQSLIAYNEIANATAATCAHSGSTEDKYQGAGGGLFVDALVYPGLTLRNTNVTNNVASQGAGLFSVSQAPFAIYDGDIRDNVALVCGGGGIAMIQRPNSLTQGYLYGVLLANNSASGSFAKAGHVLNNGTIYYVLPTRLGYHVENAYECATITCPVPGSCDDGQFMAVLPQLVGGRSYPPQCGPGCFANSTDASDQTSAICSGYCPFGHYCDEENQPHVCPSGTYNGAFAARSRDDCNDGQLL
jgi:hypothetical protein